MLGYFSNNNIYSTLNVLDDQNKYSKVKEWRKRNNSNRNDGAIIKQMND